MNARLDFASELLRAMQHDELNTSWAVNLSLLRRVRDDSPTEAELIDLLGEQGSRRYHALRKAGLLVSDSGHVAIAPGKLAANGAVVTWGNQRFWLDRDRVDTF